MKVAAFVPAKGCSSRIHNKNKTILDGEYLFKRKLKQLLNCKEIDEVWIDSESEEIHDLCKDLPVKHYYRPNQFSSNSTDGHQLFANEASVTDAQIIVQALCTAPFLDSCSIDKAIKKIKHSKDFTSLIAVKKEVQYEWASGKPCYGYDKIPNSSDLDPKVIETMSLYIVKKNKEPITKRFTDKVLLHELSTLEAIDVNYPSDLDHARYICAGQRSKKVQRLKILSKILTSPLLSDICKENKIDHFLSSEIKSLNGGGFLGYAKTLKLKALPDKHKDPNENHWEGIFSALNTYDFVEHGDVIVVSNDVKNKAYFGDLNATFAYRNGAVGVVVDGQTRDVDRVTQIGLPVFARGRQPDDIRYEGTFESMNNPIYINGILIRNNDMIFADADGVICIPQEKWEYVLGISKTSLEKEVKIKLEAAFGASPKDVLNNVGTF